MLRDVEFISDMLSKFISATRARKTGWVERGGLNARRDRYGSIPLNHLMSS